jgi:hypothetical protein
MTRPGPLWRGAYLFALVIATPATLLFRLICDRRLLVHSRAGNAA